MMPRLTRSGRSSLTSAGWVCLHVVDEGLDVLAAEQVVGDVLEGLGEVGDQHRRGIDDREAVDLRSFSLFASAIHVASRLKTGSRVGTPRKPDVAVGDIHGQPAAGHDLAVGDGLAAEQEPVVVGLELQVVADGDRRNDRCRVRAPASGARR